MGLMRLAVMSTCGQRGITKHELEIANAHLSMLRGVERSVRVGRLQTRIGNVRIVPI